MRIGLYKKISASLAVLLLVTGCAGMSSGISVGEEDIKSTQIQGVVDEILAARKTVDTAGMELIVGKQLLRNQAQFAVIRILFNQIVIDKNFTISDSDVAARRGDVINQVGGLDRLEPALVSANLAASTFDEYLRILIIVDRLNESFISSGIPEALVSQEVSKTLVATAEKLGVEVNPKYGTWNPITAAIEASDVTDGAVTPLP
ncbi:unannotated protein [freshwater metagenome]|jgi:hypothetical protein|uniref:Unannotated protein n=1 Tax=freshwater metagenome TaxID=449393 RepID=A0A6J6RJD5_9ZZZZ|nr:hypothetical protein [Actinomycetota bacterium]MSW07938.1 hypothetical protein [Actinomycetota bacterium]MSY77600.1 hypothetical protein [Actinomycetota bacterium]MSZ43195.1 hypothetical protein [Actinomycetota bacterium]MTA55904.1 hypothetical protein [Actinomycetota bacterium]